MSFKKYEDPATYALQGLVCILVHKYVFAVGVGQA